MPAPRSVRRALAAVAVIGGAVVGAALSVPASAEPAPQADAAVAFWTHARVARAVPRDFVYDPATGTFRPAARPGGGGSGGGGTTTGKSWTGANNVNASSGKVLFSMGANYYVCSANVVKDTANGRSIVATAAHCVYDEAAGAFATNWVFIPDYDAAPAPLSTSPSSYCGDTKYGCWSAQAITVHRGYASAGSFNSQATVHDFGFVAVGAGGKSGSLVESVVPEQDVEFNTSAVGTTAYAFGYPAAQKYKGSDLVYCAGPVGTDAANSNLTYRLSCDMTGGSSGGPWFSPFTQATGVGTQVSVNSYGYSGVTAMFGPKFDTNASAVYAAAQSVGTNTVVG